MAGLAPERSQYGARQGHRRRSEGAFLNMVNAYFDFLPFSFLAFLNFLVET